MAIAANFSLTRPSLLLDFSNQIVLDPRITFARTTTALFYDNKSAALAEQNLIANSQTIGGTGWTNNTLTAISNNAVAPDGTTTASLIYPTSTGAARFTYKSGLNFAPSTSETLSVYAQAAGLTFLCVYSLTGAGSGVAWFNLSTGAVGTVAGAFTATISQVGSTTWYRCTVSGTAVAASFFSLGGVDADNSTTATTSGTNGINVWGAQAESRASATVYTATTSAAVNTYTPTLQTAAINAPRFDYNPTTRESLGLLLEQASTNLALYSGDYTNAAWTKTNFTNTATTDISPDGTQNASLMVLTSTNSNHTLSQAVTLTAASYTLSVYAKAYGSAYPFVQLAASSGIYCNFDLSGGTAGTPSSGTASIQLVGNNWYRCALTFTGTAASYTLSVNYANLITATYQPSVAGNGFNGYLIWGAQAEAAPSATSYIATTSAAQTRTVDSASMTGTNFTSWYNYSGGTVYIEAASGNPTGANIVPPFTISDNTSSNYLAANYVSGGVNTYYKVNGSILQNSTVALPSTIAANTFYKTAFYFSGAGNGVSSAGQTASTYATAITAPAVTQLNFPGITAVTTNVLNGRIKKFAYYPLALTNTQIQSLSAN